MAFVNKKWRRDIGDNAVNALLRVGGCGAAAFAIKQLTDSEFTSKSSLYKTIGNLSGPAIAVVGLLADMFAESPVIRAIGQGMYTYAIPKGIAVNAPIIGDYLGLSGTTPAIMNGTPYPAIMNGIGRTPKPNFAAYAEQAAPAQTVNGLAEAMLINN